MNNQLEQYKRQAAEHALQYVRSGMAIGLGTGSTARYVVLGLAERLRSGQLRDVVSVPTSETTAALAREHDVPISTLEQHPNLDLAIDGADEIAPQLDLVKGLGGALLREKIVAASAASFIVIADDTKLVNQLGTKVPLPVEIIGFALPLCTRLLSGLGAIPTLRRDSNGAPFRTDEGNFILDCRFSGIAEPASLSAAIHSIPGVVDHGLFIGMTSRVIIASPAGISTLSRSP